MADMFQKTDDTLGEATGMFQSKIQGRSKQFFGESAQSQQALYRDRKLTGDMFKQSIRTFGMKTLMQDDKFFDAQSQDIAKQLKDVRDEAIRARQQGNMDSYKRAMTRQSELQRMKMQMENSRKSRIGNILTGIGTAAATILGAVLGTIVAPGPGTVAGGAIGVATGKGFGAWS